MKACFMGLGYIGLPTAIIAAKHGIEVIGVDINLQVVEMTNQGKLHIVELGSLSGGSDLFRPDESCCEAGDQRGLLYSCAYSF